MIPRQRAARSSKSRLALIHANDAGEAAVHIELLLPRLVEQLRLAVIFGGNKSVAGAVLREAQNPRSWKSYESVARDLAAALGRIGFPDVAGMTGPVAAAPDRPLLAELAYGGKHGPGPPGLALEGVGEANQVAGIAGIELDHPARQEFIVGTD